MHTVYVDGADNLGWSIDSDRSLLLKSIQRIGCLKTSSIFKADIIHNVWWNCLVSWNLRNLIIRSKRSTLLATSSNFINLVDPEYALKKEFKTANKFISAWVVPSTKQKSIFDKLNIRNYYQPFYLDLELFVPVCNKDEIYAKAGIPLEIVKGKIVIGSFQRDSLGKDLTKPKWQKGPELLISLLKDLPKEKIVLLLAGPRRHYVIKECKKYKIPYYYIGKEMEEDDISKNALPIASMPELYAITDIYLITSRSEGGPKAALEATATKTFVMSTDVGLTGDFINSEMIFSNEEKYKKTLFSIIEQYDFNKNYRIDLIQKQFENCIRLLSNSAMDSRLQNIYLEISKRN